MNDPRCKDFDPDPYVPPPARCTDGRHYPPCELARDSGRLGLQPEVGPMPRVVIFAVVSVLFLAAVLVIFLVIWSRCMATAFVVGPCP